MDASAPRPSLAARLGSWLDWTDAIALSGALNGGSTGSPAPATKVARLDPGALAGQIARARAELSLAITTDALFAPGRVDRPALPGVRSPLADPPVDFAPYRRRYLAHQRAMASRIGPLRAQLRAALLSASPALGHLAALDAALEQALQAREHHLLPKAPQFLEDEFERRRQLNAGAANRPSDSKPKGSSPTPAAWVADFGRTLQAVLLTELDTRWLPLDGMMDALGQHGAGPR